MVKVYTRKVADTSGFMYIKNNLMINDTDLNELEIGLKKQAQIFLTDISVDLTSPFSRNTHEENPRCFRFHVI